MGVCFPDVDNVVADALKYNGKLEMEVNDYLYGASLEPDEDELKQIPVRYGKVLDPDGYTIEILQSEKSNPLSKIILSVLDLNDSIDFYCKKLNMKLLRKRSNINSKPKDASMCAYLVSYLKLYLNLLL